MTDQRDRDAIVVPQRRGPPTAIRKLRSLLASLALLAMFLATGGFQRFVLWPLVGLLPAARIPVLSRFRRVMGSCVVLLVRAGGARLRRTGTIPTGSPVLVLMNHQSLLDIPVAATLCRPHAPAFVTRRLYAHGVPLVSLMLRIQGDPLVEPDDDPRGSIAVLRRAAQDHPHGIVLFPEGHRSRTGEVSAFQTAGIRVLLGERRMPVYLVVTDGFWPCRNLRDFVSGMWRIDGRTEVLGPFEPPASPAGLAAFADRMRETLVARLEGMRGGDL